MNTIDLIKAKASQDKIPSMLDEGLFYCEHLIQSQQLKTVLEIGTGYGIWSIHMASTNPDLKITTLELNSQRAVIAQENIKTLNLLDRITLITTDALSYHPTENFDLIFIDGPKSQNKILFQRYHPFLKQDGYIIVDNINFHGEANRNSLAQSRDLRQMMRKINNFKEWIIHESDLNVKSLEIGDGLLLISRKYQD